MNAGDNVLFLDLMYATWDEEERKNLDEVSKLPDVPATGLSSERLAEINAYSMGDTGDEDDGEAKRRAAFAEFNDRFGHTLKHRPAWLPEREA